MQNILKLHLDQLTKTKGVQFESSFGCWCFLEAQQGAVSAWHSPVPAGSSKQAAEDEHREPNVWNHSLNITPSLEIL